MLGVLLVVASLLLPSLKGVRGSSKSTGALSNIRQCGIAISQYAADHSDLPPVLFAPLRLRPSEFQYVEVDGQMIRGAWFTNGSAYVHLIRPELPPAVLSDPKSARRTRDFKLADSFYAARAYWRRESQQGPSQWVAQRLTSVMFPSSKGMMRQIMAYDVPGWPDGYPACCIDEVWSSVLWCDLSATREAQARLLRGEPNFYHHGNMSPLPFWSDGLPVDGTRDGVHGRDR